MKVEVAHDDSRLDAHLHQRQGVSLELHLAPALHQPREGCEVRRADGDAERRRADGLTAEAQRHHMAVSAVARLVNVVHRGGRDLGEQHVAHGPAGEHGSQVAAARIIQHGAHRVVGAHPVLAQQKLEERACDLIQADDVGVEGCKLAA